jgi:excisionase family DNA binding protein
MKNEQERRQATRRETEPMDRLLITVPEAARLLAVKPVTIRRRMADGDLPTIRVGRAVRVPIAAVREYVEKQQGEGNG